jgi:hypothetical protein
LKGALKAALAPVDVELTSDNEYQVHCDTNTNNGDRVYQAGRKKEGDLQFWSQLRLSRRTLDKLSTQQAHPDRGTQTTQAHHDGSSNVD